MALKFDSRSIFISSLLCMSNIIFMDIKVAQNIPLHIYFSLFHIYAHLCCTINFNKRKRHFFARSKNRIFSELKGIFSHFPFFTHNFHFLFYSNFIKFSFYHYTAQFSIIFFTFSFKNLNFEEAYRRACDYRAVIN